MRKIFAEKLKKLPPTYLCNVRSGIIVVYKRLIAGKLNASSLHRPGKEASINLNIFT